jgi:hypothetical protein
MKAGWSRACTCHPGSSYCRSIDRSPSQVYYELLKTYGGSWSRSDKAHAHCVIPVFPGHNFSEGSQLFKTAGMVGMIRRPVRRSNASRAPVDFLGEDARFSGSMASTSTPIRLCSFLIEKMPRNTAQHIHFWSGGCGGQY